MKKYILILFAVAITAVAQAQQYSRATLQATGLTCALCSNAINKSLLQLPFVETVKSEIKTSSFKVEFKEGSEVSIDEIKTAVEDAGFSVGKLEMTGMFENVAVEKDKHITIGGDVYHFLNAPSANLNGEQSITLADKGFLSPKQFKKVSGATKMKCVQSGKAESCCSMAGVKSGTRIYHVTL